MAPTRVGLIGLTATELGAFRGGNWGLQHLAALNASSDYVITAVCNSNIESAKKAIQAHNLPDAKPYGNPADLAADPNVDLIVISVHAEKHYQCMKPALLHQKDVYVEFVIANDLAQVTELYDLAEKNGVKVIVGAQATPDPALRRFNQLVKDKVVGDVVFSSFSGSLPISTADGWSAKMVDFLDVESPISRSKGILGHILCAHVHTLGDFQSVQSVFKVNEKTAATFTATGESVNPAHSVTAPDTFALQGVLQNGAISSLTLRVARSSIDNVGYRWTISGTKGEIEFTGKPTIFQNGNFDATIKVRKWNQEQEDIEVTWDEADWLKTLPEPANSLARAYDNFARGDTDGYVTFKEGLEAHRILDEAHRDAVWAP